MACFVDDPTIGVAGRMCAGPHAYEYHVTLASPDFRLAWARPAENHISVDWRPSCNLHEIANKLPYNSRGQIGQDGQACEGHPFIKWRRIAELV